MANKKHILLISYTFPPIAGIGGRRWAKFAKYLSKLGYTIHVIHSKNEFKDESLWLADVENNENIIRYEVKSNYPSILLTHPKSIIEKLLYKLTLFKVLITTKGSPYDRSLFWAEGMLNITNQLILKYKIKDVIVSCAPFSQAYFCLKLKQQFKNLNLLVDFRDPWTWGERYGFINLSQSRLSFEKEMEKNVMENFNYIIVPDSTMKEHLELVYPNYIDKIKIIPHGFDKDEVNRELKTKSENIRLLLYGTLYQKLENVFKKLAISLNNFGKNITLDIYSNNENYKSFFQDNNLIDSQVNFYPEIKPINLFNKIKNYDYVLINQPDDSLDFITTKIYEIIFSNTPIILIAKKGKLSDFIIENSLGIWFDSDSLGENIFRDFKCIDDKFKMVNFPIEKYSYKNLTDDLVNFLE